MRSPLLLVLVPVLTASTACAGPAGEASPGPPPPVPTAAAAATAPPPAAAPPSPTAVPTAVVVEGSGRLVVVPGTTPVAGAGTPTSYLVEIESGLGVDAAGFAADVDRVLADPRSWGAGGRRALRRVDRGDVTFRVALAGPRTVDRLCAPLDTAGYFSCANGDRAVLNVQRWLTGAPSYDGRVRQYRQYLVNHEVGHALGHGHERCRAAGTLAPVMLQQTKGLDGCVANPWPYP